MYVPLAAAMATFLAPATPMLDGFRINRIRGSTGSARPEQQGTDRGPVVDDDQLEILERLSTNT